VPQTSWRKSSYSHGEGTDCVEVAWQKSSYSGTSGSDCVEVAWQSPQILIRDSKNPAGPMLTVAPAAWRELLTTLP
jgi:hypothetical protein